MYECLALILSIIILTKFSSEAVPNFKRSDVYDFQLPMNIIVYEGVDIVSLKVKLTKPRITLGEFYQLTDFSDNFNILL